MTTSQRTLYCSFCGKSQHEVWRLIAGPDVYVCDADVLTMVALLAGDEVAGMVETAVRIRRAGEQLEPSQAG